MSECAEYQHNFEVQGLNIGCSKCPAVFATTSEFTRIRDVWIWGGAELTPDEDNLIGMWLNVKPSPIEANGYTRGANKLFEETAQKLGVSVADVESAYRTICTTPAKTFASFERHTPKYDEDGYEKGVVDLRFNNLTIED